MIEVAKLKNRKLAVSFQYRYLQDFIKMKHILNRGSLERVTIWPIKWFIWRGKWNIECGGVTKNHEKHMLEIFVSLNK